MTAPSIGAHCGAALCSMGNGAELRAAPLCEHTANRIPPPTLFCQLGPSVLDWLASKKNFFSQMLDKH